MNLPGAAAPLSEALLHSCGWLCAAELAPVSRQWCDAVRSWRLGVVSISAGYSHWPVIAGDGHSFVTITIRTRHAVRGDEVVETREVRRKDGRYGGPPRWKEFLHALMGALRGCSKLRQLKLDEGSWRRDESLTTVTALAPACRLLEVVDLTIDSRRLSEELSCLAQCCTQLRSVTFNGSNGAHGAKMDAGLRELASRCPQLETLVFENIADSAYISDSCDLTGGCLDLLAERCTRLCTLQFPGAARVSSGSLQRLGHACNLESVKLLNWMLLDDAAVAALAKPSLCTLRLAFEQSWDDTDENFEPLITNVALISLSQHCPRLTSLDLQGCCEVNSDGVIVVVAGCPLLTSLELHGTAVGDRGVEAIGAGLDALEWLDLSECWRITDEALGYLHRCPRLKYLDVSGEPELNLSWPAVLALYRARGCTRNTHPARRALEPNIQIEGLGYWDPVTDAEYTHAD